MHSTAGKRCSKSKTYHTEAARKKVLSELKIWCLKAPDFIGCDDAARKQHNGVVGRRLVIPGSEELLQQDSDGLSDLKDEKMGSSSGAQSSSSSSSSSSKRETLPSKRQKQSTATDSKGSESFPQAPEEPSNSPVLRELLAMMQQGKLPTTTSEQRQRQKLFSGTRYRVPSGLKEALRHGFVNPNLPPPTGLVWRKIANGWCLMPAGG